MKKIRSPSPPALPPVGPPTPAPPRLYTPSLDRPPTLDLAKRWIDARKVARSMSLYASCVEKGWIPEDLDQHILEALLKRQTGSSRYDPLKASVGKYLHVVIRGVLLNALEGQGRLKVVHEQVGMRSGEKEVDAAELARCAHEGDEADAIARLVRLVGIELGAEAERQARDLLVQSLAAHQVPHDVVVLVRDLLRRAG